MPKKIILSESGNNELIKQYIIESFTPDVEKTLLIKQFLDKNFIKKKEFDIGSDGLPVKKTVIYIVDADKNPINTISNDDLFYMLQDKFLSIYKNEKERDSFIKQVLNDWYSNKLSNYGTLSVNGI